MTIKQAYQQFCKTTQKVYPPTETRSMARIVFEDEFGVFNFEREDILSTKEIQRLQEILSRIVQNEPLQYILGQADFYGLKFKVDPNVLIPRPETEELVALILEQIKNVFPDPSLKILDIGTGSGCIPIALKKKRPEAQLTGMDISTEALNIARMNAEANEVSITFVQNDILQEEGWDQFGHFDIIVSNPPYIPFSEETLMPEHVLAFEPGIALFVDNENPLIFYKKISKFARHHLNEKGILFFECNEYNAGEVVNILDSEGFSETELLQDMNGKDRMVFGRQ